jgi:tight adherence protein B
LELIARTLQAGLSLRQGLEVAARQIPAPLGSDLQQVMHRVELGESARDALAGLAASWGNKDFLTFVFATRISRKTGANLPQIVNRITAMIRERFRLRQKMAALTAQGKLSAWIIGFLPPALLGLMAFIDPPLIRDFFALPISWAVLFAALLWETLGIFVINKMVRLEL